MAEQIDHECPVCGHLNYKIVPKLTEYIGTSAELTDPPADTCKRLPVACQRHGCDEQYHLFLKP
jgi:hypothetical protein